MALVSREDFGHVFVRGVWILKCHQHFLSSAAVCFSSGSSIWATSPSVGALSGWNVHIRRPVGVLRSNELSATVRCSNSTGRAVRSPCDGS